MANDKEWERRTTEWVNSTHRSRQHKEAQGKSLQRTETNLTDLEREREAEGHPGPFHRQATPPRHQQKK